MPKKPYIIILSIILLTILAGCGTSTNAPSTKAPAPPTPKKISEVKQYLQNYVPKEIRDKGAEISISKSTNIPGTYFVDLDWQNADITREKALLYARDFVFATYRAVYAEKLPIIYASVMIDKKGGGRILGLGLGKKVADRLPAQTWSELKMTPSDFESWMQKNYTQNIVEGKTLFDGRCFIDKR